MVVIDPTDDLGATNSGAAYLFNGASGALISALTGSAANDRVSRDGVVALTNGNYIVRSSLWNDGAATNAGAATWCSGSTGVSGPASTTNSLHGTTTFDQVGFENVVPLTNGNYVVQSTVWDNGGVVNAGAVTWGNGTTGISGPVTTANSLHGTSSSDEVGFKGVTALTNGNYVVQSPNWDNGGAPNAGAATWGDGATGINGPITTTNSLHGTNAFDEVSNLGVTALTNGNYVVASSNWDNGGVTNVGAATWGNGTTGTTGPVSTANSLHGSTTNDLVAVNGVIPLTNGNYVVRSPNWNDGATTDAGAATWGNGTTGISGPVSTTNSLHGSTNNDQVSSVGVTALTNGNYVVRSPNWANGATTDAGAATWGNGATGISGPVSTTNSLHGSTNNDQVSSVGVTALTNGNYVVRSPNWANGATSSAGAATWGSGTTGISGPVSTTNSLHGSTANDQVSSVGVTALTNGNYVVQSQNWDNGATTDAGAATWGNGTTGISGPVSTTNSLHGSTNNDQVSSVGVTALTNGNYVVRSPNWDSGAVVDAGAATWGDGTTGISGPVSTTNSLPRLHRQRPCRQHWRDRARHWQLRRPEPELGQRGCCRRERV